MWIFVLVSYLKGIIFLLIVQEIVNVANKNVVTKNGLKDEFVLIASNLNTIANASGIEPIRTRSIALSSEYEFKDSQRKLIHIF